MKTEIIEHRDIDIGRYDECIRRSEAGTVYAMSWYLDIVSPDWSLIMAKDYDFVMPLPIKTKFGIKYIIQPYFCQQLGVFAKTNLNEEVFDSFMKALPYKYTNIQLNTSNKIRPNAKKLRPNYVLKLGRDIEEIQSSCKKNCIRNIKKAKTFEQRIEETDAEAYIKFISKNASDILNMEMLQLLNELIDRSLENNAGKVLTVMCGGLVVAAVFIVFFKSKIYYLTPVSSPEGKQMQSMSLLIYHLIEKYCQKFEYLDFEGSAIKGVANFYAGFGAVPEYYPLLKKVKVF